MIPKIRGEGRVTCTPDPLRLRSRAGSHPAELRGGFGMTPLSSGFLVEADYVAAGIAEAGGDLGGVSAEWLHDVAAGGDDGVQGGGHAVHHDVEQQAGLGGGRASKDPGAADFAGGVVKGGGAVSAFADVLAEGTAVEVGGAGNVGSGHFEVADLAVGARGGHGESFRVVILIGGRGRGKARGRVW